MRKRCFALCMAALLLLLLTACSEERTADPGGEPAVSPESAGNTAHEETTPPAGETEEEFEASLAFVRKIGFSKVHVFAYSRRPGTRAYDMPGQVTAREKEDRSHRMIEATRATQQAFLQAQLGQAEEVLFEQQKEQGLWEGYTRNYTHVLAPSGRDLSGQLAQVRLESVQGESCVGKIEK